MKILVTGGAGFIGTNLVKRLGALAEVDEIAVIDDLSFGFKENLEGTNTTLYEGSILDEDLLRTATKGASVIVHLAARSSVPRSIAEPMAAHAVNATGTAMVLEAARREGAVQVIFASSSSVYGSTKELPKHEGLVPRPISPYGASKLAAESYALAWSHCYGFPVLALRFFNVYGPLQPPTHAYAAVVPAFIAAACDNRPLPIYGDGNQYRDFTFVESVVDVIVRAITDQTSHPGPVNLAFGTRVTLLEVVEELELIFGRPLVVDHQPDRPGDIYGSQADSASLRELFPDLTPTGLATGLRSTVEWFEQSRPWERSDFG